MMKLMSMLVVIRNLTHNRWQYAFHLILLIFHAMS